MLWSQNSLFPSNKEQIVLSIWITASKRSSFQEEAQHIRNVTVTTNVSPFQKEFKLDHSISST